jgi:hypothetical protein
MQVDQESNGLEMDVSQAAVATGAHVSDGGQQVSPRRSRLRPPMQIKREDFIAYVKACTHSTVLIKILYS